MCNTLRHLMSTAASVTAPMVTAATVAAPIVRATIAAALLVAAACSDGSDVGSVVNQTAGSDPLLSGVSPGAPSAPDSPAAGAAEVSGAADAISANNQPSAPPGGSSQPPSPAQGEMPASVPSSSGGEPKPSATETNFLTAGCRKDADCGESRRCELPDAGGSRAAPPAEPDAGVRSEGGDASPPVAPVGRCLAL